MIVDQTQQDKLQATSEESAQALVTTQRQALLRKLHEYLPLNQMLLPGRLETLLKYSVQYQIDQCPYHNEDMKNYSLLVDHECSQTLLPTQCMATLREHKEQVWLCKFNDQGDKFATVCLEGQILIWSIQKSTSKQNFISQKEKSSSQGLSRYKCELIYEIKEHIKMIGCVAWAPNGDWIVSCSNKDKTARVWDVTHPSKVKSRAPVSLNNQMICSMKKHTANIAKIQFHTDSIVVSCGHDKTIIIWEITQSLNKSGEIVYRAKALRTLRTPKLYVDIQITRNRFLCRTNEGAIKVILFNNIKKDLRQEYLTEEYYSTSVEKHNKSKSKDSAQPPVHLIDKLDGIVMEMLLSPCKKYILLNIKKPNTVTNNQADYQPRLELWDLERVPLPQRVQSYYGYEQSRFILTPGYAGVNQTFIICGSESTGEDAAINIWKRQTGELLTKIPGSGFNSSIMGHSNVINQVDGSPTNPYLFISCSDDETIKIWGVKDKIRVEVPYNTQKESKKDKNKVVRINVTNEK